MSVKVQQIGRFLNFSGAKHREEEDPRRPLLNAGSGFIILKSKENDGPEKWVDKWTLTTFWDFNAGSTRH
jgi:hypothetical protein